MLETLDHTIRIGSTPTFLYFDLSLFGIADVDFTYIDWILYIDVFVS